MKTSNRISIYILSIFFLGILGCKTQFVQDVHLGIWRSGTENQSYETLPSWSEFAKIWESKVKDGYRLIDFETYEIDNQRIFTGLWEEVSSGSALYRYTSFNSFKNKWTELKNDGYRLIDVEVYGSGNSLRYVGVWHRGNDNHELLQFNSYGELASAWDDFNDKGYRLIDAETFVTNNNRKYVGVWREGSGNNALFQYDTWNEFTDKWDELADLNYRLIDVETFVSSNKRYYLGVWGHGNDGYRLWNGVDFDNFQAKDNDRKKSNLRLIDFETYNCRNLSLSSIQSGCPSQCDGSSTMIIGCDNRLRGPTTNPKGMIPWESIGRLSMGCTGTLIGPKHILTAAHCVLDGSDNLRGNSIHFRLGQFNTGPCSHPFGTRYATKVYVPRDYTNGNINQSNKALDYAIVELANPINNAEPMDFTHITWNNLKNKIPYSIGYPADKTTGTSWSTGACNIFIEGPSLSLNDGEKGLLYSTNDGVGGQSGSPLYVFSGGRRKVVGVLIGSPETNCLNGEIWSSRITKKVCDIMKDIVEKDVIHSSWRTLNIPSVLPDVPYNTSCDD